MADPADDPHPPEEAQASDRKATAPNDPSQPPSPAPQLALTVSTESSEPELRAEHGSTSRQPQESNDSRVLRVWPCGCGGDANEDYLENIQEWKKGMKRGLKNIKWQELHYKRMEALVVYWADSDVKDVQTHAVEFARILEREPFNFDAVTVLELDNTNKAQDEIDDSFEGAWNEIKARLAAQKTEDTLFLLYYGGHGVIDPSLDGRGQMRRVWVPRQSSDRHLEWSTFLGGMHRMRCDVIYVFDCCHALAMVDWSVAKPEYSRRSEILCSSGEKELAGAQTQASFTSALNKILRGRRTAAGLTFQMLSEALCDDDIRRLLWTDPHWKRMESTNVAYKSRGLITLNKNNAVEDVDSGYESAASQRDRACSRRVLLLLRLRGPASDLDDEQWLRWFRQKPQIVDNIQPEDIVPASRISWEATFESNSSIAIVTVPLWLWNNMPRQPGCEYLGTVKSPNLIRRKEEARQRFVNAIQKVILMQRRHRLQTLAGIVESVAPRLARPKYVDKSLDAQPDLPEARLPETAEIGLSVPTNRSEARLRFLHVVNRVLLQRRKRKIQWLACMLESISPTLRRPKYRSTSVGTDDQSFVTQPPKYITKSVGTNTEFPSQSPEYMSRGVGTDGDLPTRRPPTYLDKAVQVQSSQFPRRQQSSDVKPQRNKKSMKETSNHPINPAPQEYGIISSFRMATDPTFRGVDLGSLVKNRTEYCSYIGEDRQLGLVK